MNFVALGASTLAKLQSTVRKYNTGSYIAATNLALTRCTCTTSFHRLDAILVDNCHLLRHPASLSTSLLIQILLQPHHSELHLPWPQLILGQRALLQLLHPDHLTPPFPPIPSAHDAIVFNLPTDNSRMHLTTLPHRFQLISHLFINSFHFIRQLCHIFILWADFHLDVELLV